MSTFSNAEKLDGILEKSKELKIKGIIVENSGKPDLVLVMDKTLPIQNNEVSLTIILKQTDPFLNTSARKQGEDPIQEGMLFEPGDKLVKVCDGQ